MSEACQCMSCSADHFDQSGSRLADLTEVKMALGTVGFVTFSPGIRSRRTTPIKHL
jgi:hypothetical protein